MVAVICQPDMIFLQRLTVTLHFVPIPPAITENYTQIHIL